MPTHVRLRSKVQLSRFLTILCVQADVYVGTYLLTGNVQLYICFIYLLSTGFVAFTVKRFKVYRRVTSWLGRHIRTSERIRLAKGDPRTDNRSQIVKKF